MESPMIVTISITTLQYALIDSVNDKERSFID